MTAGFGALYYTDCVPGQGLQGGAGFQFQAASGEPAAEAMALVQRTALYEPPPSWMRERRPVGDYPLSLAHTAEAGLLVTAAGRYLGQEANGTREGNQFTHAVVTRDPADYGLVRPAQLWAAPWWASGPAPGTELDPVPAIRARGRWTPRRSATGCAPLPAASPLLIALLSAVHRLADPRRRRTVVLVTADAERAACWIAAATLLLPQPVALRASFKIFVADARYGRHDIIALHPDWAGPWVDAGRGQRDWWCSTSTPVGADAVGADRGGAVLGAALPGRTTPTTWSTPSSWPAQFARARARRRSDGRRPDAPTGSPAAVVAAGERLTGRGSRRCWRTGCSPRRSRSLHIARDGVIDAVLGADRGQRCCARWPRR